MTAVTGWRAGTFRSLQVHNYRLYFAGMLVSVAGTWMQTVALAWLVLQITDNSAVAVAMIVAFQFLPTLLFGVYGGVLADAFDKRKLLALTQIVQAALALLLAVLTVTDGIELWMIYVIVVGNGCMTLVENPTRSAFVSEIVGDEYLANAVALNAVLMQAARVVGPAIAGVLIITVGIGSCFFVNAVSFLAVLLALALMRTAELHRRPAPGRKKGQLAAGLRYMWHERDLRSGLLAMAIIGTFGFNMAVLAPIMAKVGFDGNAGTLSAMTIAMAIGALCGGLLAASRPRITPRMMFGWGVVIGVALAVAAVTPTLGPFLVVLFAIGAAQIVFLTFSGSLFQLRSDPAMRGRVLAVYNVTIVGTTPIGGPLVGWLCEVWGPRWGFAISAVGAFAAMAIFGIPFVRACARKPNPYERSELPGGDDHVVVANGSSPNVSVRGA